MFKLNKEMLAEIKLSLLNMEIVKQLKFKRFKYVVRKEGN